MEVFSSNYLDARGNAYDNREHMDPMLGDYIYSHADAEPIATLLWLAFMAGSDWERSYSGERFMTGPSEA